MKRESYALPLDLQLFADGEEQQEEVPNQHLEFEIVDDEMDPHPIQNEDGSIEIDLGDEEESDEEPEESEEGMPTTGTHGESEEEVTEPEPKKNEAANAVIAERRKWKERMKALEKKASIAEKLMKAANVDDIDTFQQRLDALEAQNLENQGYDPQTAAAIVRQQRELQEMKNAIAKQKFDVEVTKLKDDPFFADIEEWRDELEPLALQTGQTLESAYMALRGRERMKEYQREQEQRMIANQRKKNAARIGTTSGAAMKSKPKIDLSPDQLSMAKLAVKRGLFKSVEEYAKFAK